MKVFKFITIVLLMAIPFALLGQSERLLPEITNALEKGNAAQLSNYFNATIELTILDKSGVYSKQQAAKTLADFFQENTVMDFQQKHEGNKETTSFVIGNLITKKGVFRVYLHLNTTGRQSIIQQLRIESND